MYLFFIVITLLFATYIIQMLRYYFAWKSQAEYIDTHKATIFVSVIIVARNEASSIQQLMNSLISQSYPQANFEVLIMDDHSTDNMESIFLHSNITHGNIQYFKLPEEKQGKKQALDLGIRLAKGDLIVCTDADCLPEAKWLQTIASAYERHHPKMILAPVFFTEKKILHQLFSLEFISLMASTAGAAALKRAVMCNGANIAFCKQSYLKFNDGLNLNISSGDDMFLLFNFKKEFAESILFLKSMDAIVFTNPPENLFEFFRQRLRWASKSKRYSDVDAIYLTWLVFVTNLSFFPLSILCLLNDSWLWVLFVLFFLKTMVDYTLVISFSLFFKKQKVLILLPFLTILYPFYVGIIGILSFILPIHWKGRLIRT